MGTLLVLLSFGSSELTSGFWLDISLLLLLSLDDSEGEEKKKIIDGVIQQRGNAGAVIAFDMPNAMIQTKPIESILKNKKTQKEKKNLQIAEFTFHLFLSPLFFLPTTLSYLTLPYPGLTHSKCFQASNELHTSTSIR